MSRTNIENPYEKRYYGIGYLGEGKYKSRENGKITRVYRVWHNMLTRCYNEKYHEKQPTYIGCEAYEEWHNFQNFGDWYYENYYEVEGERMALDKDILVKGNKIYSPDTCIFVPHRINLLFVKRDKVRGKYPIGVYYSKQYKKFTSQCSFYNFEENKKKQMNLGCYDTPEEAFKIYKYYKENYIKYVAEHYKDQIPDKLYDAMYNYEVDIND